MLIFSIIFLSVVGIAVETVTAQKEPSTDYWPLHVGNKWVYDHTKGFNNSEGLRIDFQKQVVLEVLGEEEVEGRTYFRLNTGQLIRRNEKGDILEYNDRFDAIPDTELLVYDFSSPANLDEGIFEYRVPYRVMPPTIGGRSYPHEHSLRRYFMWRDCSGAHNSPFLLPPEMRELKNIPTCLFVYTPDDPLSEGSVHVTFAPDIGILSSALTGNDEGEFDRYLLAEAVIAGEQKFPTNITASSWGRIKETIARKTGWERGDRR